MGNGTLYEHLDEDALVLIPVITTYVDYRTFGKTLPKLGGLNNQDPLLLDDFRFIDGIVREIERKRQEEENKS